MKICIIFPTYPPNYQRDGIGDYTRILVEHLREKGHDVRVIASGRYTGDDSKVIKIGSGAWGLPELAKVLGYVRRESFDIVNMQYSPVSYGPGMIFKLLPLFFRGLCPDSRFIATFHTLVGGDRVSRLNAIILSVFSHAVVGTNEEITFLFKKWLRIFVGKYSQVPIGSGIFPSTESRDLARKELIEKYGIRQDAVILSNFGFINPGKGIENIVSAVSRLEGKDRYKLFLIGAEREEDSEYRRAISDWIKAEGVENNVVWIGEEDGAKVSNILKGSDIYVAPYSDGISIRRSSLMAAIVNGLPVISTLPRVEAPYFKHGENVLLVEKGDVLQLASAIERLADDVAMRDRLSANILKLAAEFDGRGIAGRMAKCYADALAGGASFVEAARALFKICLESKEFVLLNAAALMARKYRRVSKDAEGASKILLIQLNSVGDVIMSAPVLRGLSEHFNGAGIDCLVQPNTKPLLENNPYVNRVLIYEDRFWRKVFSDLPLFVRCIAVLKFIAKERYDLCVDLGGTFGSAVVTALSGATYVVGPARLLKCGIFSTGTGKYYDKAVEMGEKHVLRQYLEVAGSVGCEKTEEKEEIFLSKEDIAAARAFLTEHALEDKSYAVIHSGAKWPPKRWPETYFARLVTLLQERMGIRAVLVGSSKEKDLLEAIKNDSGSRGTVIAATLSLRALSHVIERARVFIGNDSGPAHIAAATGTPIVEIFGPTDPETCAPTSDRTMILHDKISCWPCVIYFRRTRCEKGANACLSDITPERVFETVQRLVG